jgi:hypothetical protein
MAASVTATAGKVTPEDVRRRYAADPGLAPVFAAIDSGAASTLLELIDYQPGACGGRGDDGCPAGVAAGTLLPKTNVGEDTFYVSAEMLRPYFDLILGGTPPELDFVAWSTSTPSRYLLGFDGAVKGHGFAPLEDPATMLSGVLLTIDTAAAHPVQRIDLLAEMRGSAVVGVAATQNGSEEWVIEFVTQRG